jgi:hypothetical protein
MAYTVCLVNSDKYELIVVNVRKSLLTCVRFQDVNHALKVAKMSCAFTYSLEGGKLTLQCRPRYLVQTRTILYIWGI